MRAVQIEQHGGPEAMRVVDVPLPEPGPAHVRVRHTAIGVNYIDTYYRTGLYGAKLPAILGEEAAGTIDAIGEDVMGFAMGDRVAYVARGPGSYAEARVVEASRVVKLPPHIGDDIAAAMMLKGLTVQYLLRRTRTGLERGDMIVWHAAAGGVGLIACQWAHALGYRVIATAGGNHKCSLALAHGAAHAIDYTAEDVVKRVKELTEGRGVKVVFDSVGKDTWERSLDCCAPFGLVVSFGNASGAVPPISLLDLSKRGSLYVTRPTLQTHLATPGAMAQMSAELFDMVARGAVRIEIGQRFALDEAAHAHRALESRATVGATVLLP